MTVLSFLKDLAAVLLLCLLVPYLVSLGWHKGKINAYMEKAAYTPVPGTPGDVGQRTKKVIVDSSKNIHKMSRKELIERNARAAKTKK